MAQSSILPDCCLRVRQVEILALGLPKTRKILFQQALTGLYGMNFRHMPELEVPWAYPVLLTGMLLFTITGLLYAKKQKWLR